MHLKTGSRSFGLGRREATKHVLVDTMHVRTLEVVDINSMYTSLNKPSNKGFPLFNSLAIDTIIKQFIVHGLTGQFSRLLLLPYHPV